MKPYIGKCRICGKETKLTFEHIPPSAANNRYPIKTLTDDSFVDLITSDSRFPWDVEGLRYKKYQKGFGLYSLCDKCNNLTGAYYGNEYIWLANQIANYFCYNKSDIQKGETFHFKADIYPLRFIKQVISMFCSVSIGLTDKHPELKEFLLNKDSIIYSPNFKVSIYCLKSQGFSTPGIVVMSDLSNNSTRLFSSIDMYPFGFIFDYDKNYKDNRFLDITEFAKFGYDEKATMEMVVPIYERNTPFPLDFRTKDDIANTTQTKNNFKVRQVDGNADK